MPTLYYESSAHNDYLAHHGVLGQKWGKRNGPPYPLGAQSLDNGTINTKYKIFGDGRIVINEGVELQRLVNSKQTSQLPHGITYASFTGNDNAKYINYIGKKGLFGGGRDTKLTITTKTKLKSPSVQEGTRVLIKIFMEDNDAKRSFENSIFGYKITERKLKEMLQHPDSKEAKTLYTSAIVSLGLSSTTKLRDSLFDRLSKAGYNMIRDENDVSSGLTKNPIILFDFDKTATITMSERITDEMRKTAKQTVKEQKAGRKRLEKQGIIPIE